MFKKDIDYKKFIGKKVSIKTSNFRHRIEGVLSNVYCDVLVVQGFSCWGVLDKDITAFELTDEQLILSL